MKKILLVFLFLIVFKDLHIVLFIRVVWLLLNMDVLIVMGLKELVK